MFSSQDVTSLAHESLYQGFFRLVRHRLQHALFQGGTSAPMVRELLVKGTAVAVLPWDPVSDRIALVEQFRVGAWAAGDPNPWLLEVVAGMADKPGESLESVAHRELAEEAGITANKLTYLYHYYPSPGGSDEQIALFVAEADLSALTDFHGVEDEHEDIRLHGFDRSQVPALEAAGRINNAATLLSLMWLERELSGRHRALKQDES